MWNLNCMYGGGNGCGNEYCIFHCGTSHSKSTTDKVGVVPVRNEYWKRCNGNNVEHIDSCICRKFIKHDGYDLFLRNRIPAVDEYRLYSNRSNQKYCRKYRNYMYRAVCGVYSPLQYLQRVTAQNSAVSFFVTFIKQ